MKNKISRAATVVAGIIIFLLVAAMFVISYVLLGLWFVVVPTILGAFVGSRRFDEINKPKRNGFTVADLTKTSEDFDKRAKAEVKAKLIKTGTKTYH
jgi:hypothetical protein